MDTPHDVLFATVGEDGDFVFTARPGSRLAAIVQSLVAEPYQVDRRHWSALADRDPVSARYVIEQLSAATESYSAARLAVVAMDAICLCLLAPTPEAPHAP